MPGKLPDKIDRKRLAQQGAVLEGEIPAAALLRLNAAYRVVEPAQVQVRFGWSGNHRPQVTGTVSARLESTCQRCLQTFDTVVEATVDVVIGEAPRDTEQDYELVLPGDEPLNLVELVEDELLLEAPMIPVHPPSACTAPAGASEPPAQDSGANEDEPRRPFADLPALMARPKK